MRQTVKSHFAGARIALLARRALELDERLLHDIARPVAIAQNARGKLEQRKLEAPEQSRQVIDRKRFGIVHNSL